jgi:hypothetical protein
MVREVTEKVQGKRRVAEGAQIAVNQPGPDVHQPKT